jgi:hypothetical protein
MCFEDMIGLKINYHKSKVIVWGSREPSKLESLTSSTATSELSHSCTSVYLSRPDRKLTLDQWLYLVWKPAGKIEPWLSRLLSSWDNSFSPMRTLTIFPSLRWGSSSPRHDSR